MSTEMGESVQTEELSSNVSKEFQGSKKRKVCEKKTVVTMKIEENDQGKLKTEGLPDDCWSWRKYGQKPIKGSPYPRGYYKCSTSKGCPAKKQVDICKTDASMLIITYTSSHNHSIDPSLSKEPKMKLKPKLPQEEHLAMPKLDQSKAETPIKKDDGFQYCQLNKSAEFIVCQDEIPVTPMLEEPCNLTSPFLFDEETLSDPRAMTFSTTKLEENDFFDELEELPLFSSFKGFFRSNFYEERVAVQPS